MGGEEERKHGKKNEVRDTTKRAQGRGGEGEKNFFGVFHLLINEVFQKKTIKYSRNKKFFNQ